MDTDDISETLRSSSSSMYNTRAWLSLGFGSGKGSFWLIILYSSVDDDNIIPQAAWSFDCTVSADFERFCGGICNERRTMGSVRMTAWDGEREWVNDWDETSWDERN